ncbi:hypothetical protein B0H19DRAFT_682596 [Mycena capillaripes]|nr:hypothetical protein B0H19DRAFT_682596 [Mycena capillaripes]
MTDILLAACYSALVGAESYNVSEFWDYACLIYYNPRTNHYWPTAPDRSPIFPKASDFLTFTVTESLVRPSPTSHHTP